MASYLRPRRGKKATAIAQRIVLKRGEIFFECPDTGMGTGMGRIKIGDGITEYENLPYFMDPQSLIPDINESTVEFTETLSNDNDYLFSIISSGAKMKNIIAAVKNLLTNLSNTMSTFANHTHKYAGSNEVGGAATKAVNDNKGQAIHTTYIKGISINGKVITYTKGDGSTGTITTQDTTYNIGTAAVAGITKLYTGVGTNTDGTMTQKAITDYFNNHNHNSIYYKKTEIDTMIRNVGGGGVHVGTSAPSNTQYLWIDTANGSIAKYYNGSAWVNLKASAFWG